MQNKEEASFKSKEFGDLDIWKFALEVGMILVRTPLISHQLGHKKPSGTIKHYFHPEVAAGTSEHKAAMQYVVDLFKDDTVEMLKVWFGPYWEAQQRSKS